MTELLVEALRATSRLRRGYVICNEDGSPKTDGQCNKANYAICDRAGLPRRGWHVLRHTFATDAARFAVNPFTLMQWLGHKAMTETLGYVAFARAHARSISPAIHAAGDPDRRVIQMLGARRRGNLTATDGEGVEPRNTKPPETIGLPGASLSEEYGT